MKYTERATINEYTFKIYSRHRAVVNEPKANERRWYMKQTILNESIIEYPVNESSVNEWRQIYLCFCLSDDSKNNSVFRCYFWHEQKNFTVLVDGVLFNRFVKCHFLMCLTRGHFLALFFERHAEMKNNENNLFNALCLNATVSVQIIIDSVIDSSSNDVSSHVGC